MAAAPVLSRLFVLVVTSAAALAFADRAIGGEVWMQEAFNENALEASVHYRAHAGEANDIVVAMSSPRTLTITDRGRSTHGHWGWGGDFGCATGATSTICRHERTAPRVPITGLFISLADGDDSVRLDASVPATLRTRVFAGRGVKEVDLRGGSVRDSVSCDPNTDFAWLYRDPSERLFGDVINCNTQSLGGHLTSSPAASSWGSGRIDVFWRGQGMDLRHRAFDNGWMREESLETAIASDPDAVSWEPGWIDVFARPLDGGLTSRSWTGRAWSITRWFPVTSVGGTGAPAVASPAPGVLNVFYRGADNRLIEMAYEPWNAQWTRPAPHEGDFELTSVPAATSRGHGRIDLVARGGDGAFYLKLRPVWDTWTGWTSLGGQFTSGPAIAALGQERLAVVGRGTDNALYVKYFDPFFGWLGWWRIGGKLTQGDPAVVSSRPGELDVFVRGPDNDLMHLSLG